MKPEDITKIGVTFSVEGVKYTTIKVPMDFVVHIHVVGTGLFIIGIITNTGLRIPNRGKTYRWEEIHEDN